MDRELQILTLIEENKEITQRELSREMGLALGTINNVLQKMISDGWLRVVQKSPRTVHYLITDEGNLYKAKAYVHHIETSYKVISDFKKSIKSILEEQIHIGVTHFFLYGSENDIYRLLKMSLLELKRVHNISFKPITILSKVTRADSLILTWDIDSGEKIEGLNLLRPMIGKIN
jgi:DNA-binding MarR family transcriptional regulator